MGDQAGVAIVDSHMPEDGWVAAAALVSLSYGIYSVVKSAGLLHRSDSSPEVLRVVVTGGTRGLGRALATEFASHGDHVLITGRKKESAEQAVSEIRAACSNANVFACECDVADAQAMVGVANEAEARLGGVDVWVNNAGCTQSVKQPLMRTEVAVLSEVVATNLLGTMFGCRAAFKTAEEKTDGRPTHIFNVDGAGSTGGATASNVAYGATKAAIPQLSKSLDAEGAALGLSIGVHTISPGMVLTDLLLSEENRANPRTMKIFNILADHPSTVAAWLVPRMRHVSRSAPSNGGSTYLRYLTPPSVAWRFATAPWRNRSLCQSISAPSAAPPSTGGCPFSLSSGPSSAKASGGGCPFKKYHC